MNLMIFGQNTRASELTGSYYLDPIEVPNGESFSFVVKIFRDASEGGKYFPRVYRHEFFRLSPSFRREKEVAVECDEELLVEDMTFSSSELSADTKEEALRQALNKIKELLDPE